ncbi:hypothetical protein D1007_21227 [Hordeum vulgare]|nr:hypothetical protein D1007_21227 [Hordeum vulgare]
MFLCRLAHNSLPARIDIKRIHIELDTRCPMCNRLDEDGKLLFLCCKRVKAVWREHNLQEVRLMLCECQNSSQVRQEFCALPVDKKQQNSSQVTEEFCALPADKKQRVAVLPWDWWTARTRLMPRKLVDSSAGTCWTSGTQRTKANPQ